MAIGVLLEAAKKCQDDNNRYNQLITAIGEVSKVSYNERNNEDVLAGGHSYIAMRGGERGHYEGWLDTHTWTTECPSGTTIRPSLTAHVPSIRHDEGSKNTEATPFVLSVAFTLSTIARGEM